MHTRLFSRAALFAVLAMSLLFMGSAYAQSTGTITGTVTDATGAVIPNAAVIVRNQATGDERQTVTDSAGIYLVPSLTVGQYRVEVKATGMQPTAATGVELSVGSTARQDFIVKVSTATQTIEVESSAPVVDSSTASVGAVVNQRTVQEIPLNGRHFVDLALLIPGTVTPPANGFLTAPLRGQGSFAFNSAGAREDQVNYMINGINLSDPNQNQITFQPTINTIEEFKVDNQTFSAEYGRNSGSIVNIATRRGTNQWHGDLYEFVRNSYFDARNFTNTTETNSGAPNPQASFIRNQFGGNGGGDLKKDKMFIYLSYEGLRQRQAVPLSSTTLTSAQRVQAQTSSDSTVQALLPLIPLANSGTSQFVGSVSAPVNIEQGTADFTYVFSEANRADVYYAIQRDQRNEPPSTDGNSFVGGGDQRNGNRQILTLNDTWVIDPTLVNEARLGFNRIHIVFDADTTTPSSQFGIDNGGVQTLPQITVSGNFTFGGISGFPQGRGDDVAAVSDTLSWVHGNHTIKYGGEFRRQNSDNFSATPGTFSFPSITAFLADQATSFTSNTGNRSNRTYGNALGAFVTDTWKIAPTFTATIGMRYDFYGTPTEAQNRFVDFNLATDTLQQVHTPYNQSALNFEPRVGLAWDPFKNGKTVIRSAYAIMTDQPTLGYVTGLAGNPPFAVPVSFVASTAVPFVTLGNAFGIAGGSIAPTSIAQNYHDAYVSEWNFNIQQQFGRDWGMMVGYFGSKGTDLNLAINANQPINGVNPYLTLAMNSPIDPGAKLGTITQQESVGNSSYNGLWVTAQKRFSKGFQFNASYTFAKSIDENSKNNAGVTIQNSYDIEGDRGLSDFDARNRFVVNAIYVLPFKGNRLKEGWQVSLIDTAQSGSPLNFHISTTTLTGGLTTVRPDVTGPVTTGFSPATNLSAAAVTYVQNPSVFFDQGATGFGNLGRNTVTGPGFFDLDFALVKNTRINDRFRLEIRADAFDLLNQANFTNPNLTDTVLGQFAATTTSTFGVITGGTRFTSGDFGSSRQLQLALKLHF